MKDLIQEAVRQALVRLGQDHEGFQAEQLDFTVTPPARREHGDYSTNAALVAAGLLGIRDRRGLAEQLAAGLRFPEGTIKKIEVAGPGFLNFHVDDRWWQHLVAEITAADAAYGRLDSGQGRTVQVEFVSANPTGPLTVGHGRNAILGDVVARMYERAGYQVTREYYFNDAGRQMRMLADSVLQRAREQLQWDSAFPEDGYEGEYVRDIAAEVIATAGEDKVREGDLQYFQKQAEERIFADINGTLARLGIEFDAYFSEGSLYRSGAIEQVLADLAAKQLTYDKDGAVWLRGQPLGLEKDPVLVKSSGEPTYRLPDMAYHIDKIARGFDHIVDVFGADHIDTCQEVLAVVKALGHRIDHVHVVLYQFVTLQRGGVQVKMSTRKATYETLDDLIDEVGADAVRYFFTMRSPNSHMEFDLDLAKKQANDNPMYYVQYAHARICSILRRPEAVELLARPADLRRLQDEAERALIGQLALAPEALQRALGEHEPHRLTTYAAEVANAFHGFYESCRVLGIDDPALARARLELCRAARIVLRNTLQLIGIGAPEQMERAEPAAG